MLSECVEVTDIYGTTFRVPRGDIVSSREVSPVFGMTRARGKKYTVISTSSGDEIYTWLDYDKVKDMLIDR